jgi:hypothetical protein
MPLEQMQIDRQSLKSQNKTESEANNLNAVGPNGIELMQIKLMSSDQLSFGKKGITPSATGAKVEEPMTAQALTSSSSL